LLSRYPPAYFVLIVVGFLMVTSGGMANAFLPIQAEQLDPSGLLVGLVVSSYHSVRLFFELPSGVVSDRIGRKKLILLGILMSAGGALVCSSATSVYTLILGRALWGVGAAFFFLNNTALIMNMFEPSSRGKALGTFQSLEMVGSVVGQPFGAFIAQFLGYSASYHISAAMVGFGVIPILVSKDFSRRASASLTSSENGRKVDLSKMVRNPYLLILCVTVFIRMMINRGITGTILELYLVDYLAISLGIVGVALMIRSAGFSLTTLGSGILADKFGSRLTVVVGTVLEAMSMILYTFSKSLETVIPVVILDGLGSGMLSVSLMVILSHQVSTSQTGSAVGLYRTFQDAGAVIGPIALMAIYGAFDIYASFHFVALILLANIPFLLRLPKGEAQSKVVKEETARRYS
jgi:DHA1 family multidrug resistance protein-like MFS transporter